MKILYHAPIDLSQRIGHATHVRRLIPALEARGVTVRVLALRPERPLEGFEPRGGIRFYSRRGPRVARHLLAEREAARLIREEVRAFSPDAVVIRQEPFTLAPFLLGSPLARRRLPLVVESNSSLAAMARIGTWPGGRADLAAAIEGRLLRRADLVVVVSERLKRIQVERQGCDPARVAVIPNGAWLPPIDTEEKVRSTRVAGRIGREDFLAVFVGNLNRAQGLAPVLEGLARLPGRERLRLWIIGEGVERSALEEAVRRFGIAASVEFLGALREEEAARRAQAAQVLLAPYDPAALEEIGGDPLKVIWALGCDRPVLVSDAETLRWVDRTGGEVVGGEDRVSGWAASLERWIERWESAGRPAAGWPWPLGGGPGRRFIEQERTWEHAARRWEEALAPLLDRESPVRKP